MLGIVRVKMLKGEKGDTGASGDYATLTNKPSIGGVELNGNKTASDLGLGSLSEQQNLLETVTALNESVNDVEDELAVHTTDINAIDQQVADLQSDVAGLQAVEPLYVMLDYNPSTLSFSNASEDETAIYNAVTAHRPVHVVAEDTAGNFYPLWLRQASETVAYFTMIDVNRHRLFDVGMMNGGYTSIGAEFVLSTT